MKKITLILLSFLFFSNLFSQDIRIDSLCQTKNYKAKLITDYKNNWSQQVEIIKNNKRKYIPISLLTYPDDVCYYDDSTLIIHNPVGTGTSTYIIFNITDTITVFYYPDVYARSDKYKLIARRPGNYLCRIAVQDYRTSEIIFYRTVFDDCSDVLFPWDIIDTAYFDETTLVVKFHENSKQKRRKPYRYKNTYRFNIKDETKH